MRNLVPEYIKKLPVRRPSSPAVPGEIRVPTILTGGAEVYEWAAIQ